MPYAEFMELVYSLIGYPDETEWIEFKEGNSDPVRIARDISALANSAAYLGRDFAYKLWGIEDGTHALVGTGFQPRSATVGNQALSMWLKRMLTPNALYDFLESDFNGKHFVVLQIRAAASQPVYFDKDAYIREGSSTTRLEPGSAKERELWHRLQRANFSSMIAEPDVTDAELEERLDIDSFFDLLGIRKPSDGDVLAQTLAEQGIIRAQDNGRFAITNLGALLVGRKLSVFPGLRKRALRVIRFEGTGSFGILGDWEYDQGYALALHDAEERIMESLPATEISEGAFRRIRYAIPQRAVRELVSNATMHQDLSDATSGPLVGIYSNRIEFSNPGVSLIPTERLLNAPPKSRNADLVGLMRRMDLCEEGGTGWDIVVAQCEAMHLPAPHVESSDELGTKVTLYFGRAYDRMTKAERRSATYWHACLLYAQGMSMSNQTLRDRFGLSGEKKYVIAMSRLIRACCEANLLREEDEESSDKFRRYLPYWA